MKKTIFPILSLFFILALFYFYAKTDAISEVNANTNLPFPLTLPEKDLEYGGEYVKEGGFGGYVVRKGDISFWVSGWPDVIDKYHVTEYRFKGSEYTIFNIYIGTSINDATGFLKKFGYNQIQNYTFEKNNQVRITLFCDENNNIYEISVRAISTNKNNIIF